MRDPRLDEFFDPNRDDRVFVKNIERVQGDERDAIILAVGYCKDGNGNLPYRFGPLLQEGGERRLNVAVTRARKRLTLVSSFTHVDMTPGKSKARGVELLRDYLQYVATGGNDLGMAGEAEPLNAFEHDVKRRLEAAGLIVHAQIGSSGYRIDFGIVHPDMPERYLLAVEADGASYHSSPTARDRDRLRQQVLEHIGWRFHRIWSTDWFYNAEAEVDRVLDAVEEAWQAVQRGQPVRTAAVAPHPSVISEIATARAGPVGPKPPLPRRPSSIEDYSAHQLKMLERWVGSDGVMRTDEELVREMFSHLPFASLRAKIRAALERAVAS
jgi:very-short-patch-repair endonuclease